MSGQPSAYAFLADTRQAFERLGASIAPAMQAAQAEMGKFTATLATAAEEGLRAAFEAMRRDPADVENPVEDPVEDDPDCE